MAADFVNRLSSLNDRPLAYKLNMVAGVVGVLVMIVIVVGAARTIELPGVDAQSGQPTLAEVRAETANVRAETQKLAADLKSIQADLRDVAALPKDAKLALQQQQAQKAIKDLTERQDKLEQIILSNPAKALELSLLQRDLENVKAAQQSGLTALKATVDRIYSLTWALVALALSIALLAIGQFLKGKQP